MKYLRLLVAICLLASWIIVGYIIIGSRTKSTSAPVTTTSASEASATPTSTTTTTSASTTTTSLTAAAVASHNSTSDCYLIINNKVYDVTSYLSQHPGGARTITPYCGKEATNAFDTKDQGQPHSAMAEQLLKDYYIADLTN